MIQVIESKQVTSDLTISSRLFPPQRDEQPGLCLVDNVIPPTQERVMPAYVMTASSPPPLFPPGHRVVSDQSFILAKEITGRYLLPRSLQRFSLTEQAGRSVSPER